MNTIYLPTHNCTQCIDIAGDVLPWFSSPFLDVLQTWDISSWNIFEWGSGYSTLWFSKHANHIKSVEIDLSWFELLSKEINHLNIKNIDYYYKTSEESNVTTGHGIDSNIGENSEYVNIINETEEKYDCIIIDGKHRNTCAKHALNHIKNNGIIILDNANQASINLDSTPTFELFKKYEHFSFLDPIHGSAKDWKTDYWIIKK